MRNKKKMAFIVANNMRDIMDEVNKKGLLKEDILSLLLTRGSTSDKGYTLVFFE